MLIYKVSSSWFIATSNALQSVTVKRGEGSGVAEILLLRSVAIIIYS